MERAKASSIRAAIVHSVLMLLSAGHPAMCQIAYNAESEITRLQQAVPWHGPGAALLNPAHLGETGKAHGLYGIVSSISGKSGQRIYQIAGALPMGLAAGLGGFRRDSKIDNSQAVYQDNSFVPMLSYGWPAARNADHRLSIGAALPVYVYNAFNAVKSTSTSLDLGLLWVGNPAPGAGCFRVGLAVARIIPPKVVLPDGRGYYSPKGETTMSLAWTSAGGIWELHASWFARKVGFSEGPGTKEEPTGLGAWGVKVTPYEWVALKLERPRLGGSSSTYGLEFHPTAISGVQPSLEFNLGHDKGIHPRRPQWLWGRVQDEGRGYLLSGNLAVSY